MQDLADERLRVQDGRLHLQCVGGGDLPDGVQRGGLHQLPQRCVVGVLSDGLRVDRAREQVGDDKTSLQTRRSARHSRVSASGGR